MPEVSKYEHWMADGAELMSPAELNIPYYPLLRRDVDCIIALDASADSQDLWFTKAEGWWLVFALQALLTSILARICNTKGPFNMAKRCSLAGRTILISNAR